MTADPYLQAGEFIDSDHPAVRAFALEHAQGATERERAVSLYYAVRDGIRYDPFLNFMDVETYRASSVLARGVGFCVGKSALFAACARAIGIAARIGFADVKNHLTTPRLRERMGSDVFIYHGYAELLLEGQWVKATPVFNQELCQRFRVKPLEFDDRRHMEYVNNRGTFADVPAAQIMRDFRAYYPDGYTLGGETEKGAFG